jgi:hypothetical protein
VAAQPRILELPFVERPVIELLHLENPGPVDTEYAGYGWARVDRLWLETQRSMHEEPIDDALVLAIHSADDGDPLPDDVDLEFELPGGQSFLVSAALFLERWLPRLPQDPAAIVLAMCNPFDATLRAQAIRAPIYFPYGAADAWLVPDDLGPRIRLSAPSWGTIRP